MVFEWFLDGSLESLVGSRILLEMLLLLLA